MKPTLKSAEWEQERAILETTLLASEIMKEQGVSKKELAARLSLTPGRISQLLKGTHNMTVRTLSDVFRALGYKFHPSCRRPDESEVRTFLMDVPRKPASAVATKENARQPYATAQIFADLQFHLGDIDAPQSADTGLFSPAPILHSMVADSGTSLQLAGHRTKALV